MPSKDGSTRPHRMGALRGAGEDEGKRDACLITVAGQGLGRIHRLRDEEVLIGRGEECGIRIHDDSVSRRHARVYRNSSQAFCVQDLGSTNGTFCNGAVVKETVLGDGDKILVGSSTILKFACQDYLEMNYYERMFDSAVRDWLTRCFNKRYFEEHLAIELKSALRHKAALSLIMFDLDHFKRVNDNYGHLAGDQVLLDVCDCVRETLRVEDIFARYGGEEFVIMARHTDGLGAHTLAERCRRSVEAAAFEFDGQVVEVTISVGVSACIPGHTDSVRALIAAADRALYAAKRNGRNRVEISDATVGKEET